MSVLERSAEYNNNLKGFVAFRRKQSNTREKDTEVLENGYINATKKKKDTVYKLLRARYTNGAE